MTPVESDHGIHSQTADESSALPALPDLFLKRVNIGQALTDLLRTGQRTMDWNGHWMNGARLNDTNIPWEHLPFLAQSLAAADVEKLQEALRPGAAPLATWVTFEKLVSGYGCTCCGEDLTLETNGKDVRVATSCLKPEGVFPLEFELNVPSGKLVFANDLSEYFPITGYYDISRDSGKAQISQAYAELGLAHCFCGNTRPAVYQTDLGSLTVSASPDDERWDEQTDQPVKIPAEDLARVTPPGVIRASISTDLWRWSAADYNELKSRFGGSDAQFNAFMESHCFIVNIEPGMYRVIDRPMGHEDEHKAATPYHYATLQRVSEPKPR